MVDGLTRIGREGRLVEKLRRGNERCWLAIPAVIVLAAAVLFLSAGNVFPQAGVRKPNVVLIMADDMGYEVISANGGTTYQTPAFDRMAQEGMRFTNAHSQPLCTPSRVKLMTGKYNWRNYVDFARMEPGQYTFAHFMREAGYATGLVGKWQLWSSENTPVSASQGGTRPSEAGFDEYMHWAYGGELSPADKARYDAVRFEAFGHPATRMTSRYWHPAIVRDGVYVHTSAEDYGPDLFSDFALDFIERHQDEPFFLYYPMVLPHWPFVSTPNSQSLTPQDKFDDRDEGFAGKVAYADYLIGRLLDHLDTLGLSNNTLVLFIGDNGTDGRIASGFELRTLQGGKDTTKDSGTRVPLLARWSGQVSAGRVSENLVDFSDFFVTLSDLAQHPLPASEIFDGQSFLPQLRGEKGNPREWLYMYYDKKPRGRRPVHFARTERYKLYGSGAFFDVLNDWDEGRPLQSLTPQETAVRTLLQRVLDYSGAPPVLSGVSTAVDGRETPELEIPHPVIAVSVEPDRAGISYERNTEVGERVGESEVDSLRGLSPEASNVLTEGRQRDPDAVGVEVRASGDFLKIIDGETADYQVVLEGPPTRDVIIAIEKDFGPPLLSASPATLVFTPDNWDQPRQVVVSSPQDSDSMSGNGLFFHTVTSDDDYYDGLAATDVRVRSTDNDTFSSGSAPFRAWLARLPAQHDGGDFTVRLGFSAVPDSLTASQIQNDLIAMQAGRIVGVQPVNNRVFTLTLQPDGNADVVMTIRPTGSCGGVTDICTRRSGSLLPLQTGYVAWIPGALK